VTIEHVTVVGGGLMGNGIAQVVSRAGLHVTIVDLDDAALALARERIERGYERWVRSERVTAEEAAAALARIELSTDLEAAGAAADHVIEAVVEVLEVKQDVFRRLDAVCAPQVVLASNTSQFSISRLAASTARPDRVIGSHWFNPPPLMDLIELVRGVETSDATVETALSLAERYGKQTVLCRRDTPGFITSRLVIALGLEAMRIVEEGIADVDDVNRACVLAFNHRMGPLDTMDLSGLDVALHVANAMTEQYGERFLAPQNIRALVAAGHLGRKTGRGFTDYEGS
jgi:3-hydroxybutyryl-CoA dehydrogenase